MSLLATVDRTALETLRTTPTPFLTKTYQIVDDPAVDDVISWNSEGSAFVVHRPAEFARDLIPKYFKHNNFSSFVRQLNTYGFRKIVSERWEFANDCFKKGEKQLLKEIHRRKLTTGASPAIPLAVPLSQGGSPAASGEEQVPSSSNSSSGNTTARSTEEIVEENERLRKENEELSKELEQMKRFCNSVFVLMSKNRENLKEEEGEGSEGMRLFGVSIGSKRKRGEEPNPTVDRGSDSQHWMVCYPKSEQRVRSG